MNSNSTSLGRCTINDCTPVAKSMEVNSRLTKDIETFFIKEKQEIEEVPYRHAVGSLLCLSVCTRTDIIHAINVN